MSLGAEFLAPDRRQRPQQVFDVFTARDGQEAFYGQDDLGWIVRSQCDPRVGGV
jgi:hypothetical protein